MIIPVSRAGNTVVIAAAIIAAVRLAREETIGNTPRVVSRLSESIALAMRIYKTVQMDYPDLFREAKQGPS